VNHTLRLREAARRSAARLALVLACALPARLPAQQLLSGRVLQDGRPAAGVAVQLHRVTRNQRGQIDSTRSASDGSFRLRLPPVDSAAGFTVFFTTALAGGVRYFGPAVHPGDTPGGYQIAVYDTSSAAALADSVRLIRRDLFLIPEMDGSMQLAEVVRLRNLSRRTLVADRRPLVAVTLPAGADAFEAGEGDRADSATAPGSAGLVRMGDRAWVTAPLVPGDRDFFFRYRLPARVKRLPLPGAGGADTLYVYVRQPAAEVAARGLGEGVPYSAEGENFVRYQAIGLPRGAATALDWRGPAPPPVDPRWTALAIAGVILLGGTLLAARRRRAAG
jgi:hypothetical protein